MKGFSSVGLVPGLVFVFLNGTLALAEESVPVQPSDAWSLSPAQVVGGLSQDSGLRLMDPLFWDFNGDGIEDLAVAASAASPQGVEAAGSLYILLGKAQSLTGRQELSDFKAYDYRIDGIQRWGQLGMTLSRADYNGDGHMDLAVSEPGARNIYIVYGNKRVAPGHYKILDERIADLVIKAPENASMLGLSLCSADFNKDGSDDLVGSYLWRSNNGQVSSRVFLLPMRRHVAKRIVNLSEKIHGLIQFSRALPKSMSAVHSCAVGDFDDDHSLDLALGLSVDSYEEMANAGSVSIVYQVQRHRGSWVDLSNLEEGWGIRLYGTQANAGFGYALAAGDLTGDDRDELIVSAPRRLIAGPESEGAVYIFDNNQFPKQSGAQPESLRLLGKGGSFGFRLYAQDLNGDQRADLGIMAPYANSAGGLESGRLEYYFGGPHFKETLSQHQRPDFTRHGGDFMRLGLAAALGDWNGDGKLDLALRSGQDPLNREETGALIVLSKVSEQPADAELGDDFMSILAPSKGGELAAKVERVDWQGKSYWAWLSPGGLGTRSVLCLQEAASLEMSPRQLSSAEDCAFNIVGPEASPIVDFSFNLSVERKLQLTLAMPQFEHAEGRGLVVSFELPDNASSPLALRFSPQSLAKQTRSYYVKGQSAWLGNKIAWEDYDGDGVEDLWIAAPSWREGLVQHGALFIVSTAKTRALGLYDLSRDEASLALIGPEHGSLGSDWKFFDLDLDGRKELLILNANERLNKGEERSALYVLPKALYKSGQRLDIQDPRLGAMRIVGPSHRAGLRFLKQACDLNGDGFEDLVIFSPRHRTGLQRMGAVYGIWASPSVWQRQIDLNEQNFVDLSILPNRNERFLDLIFARQAGQLQLLLIKDRFDTENKVQLERYAGERRNYFSGHRAPKSMTLLGRLALDEPAQFLALPDANLQDDWLWILYPYAGDRRSDQGRVHRLTWQTSP